MIIGCDGIGYWYEEGESGRPTQDTEHKRRSREARTRRTVGRAYDAEAHEEYMQERAERGW